MEMKITSTFDQTKKNSTLVRFVSDSEEDDPSDMSCFVLLRRYDLDGKDRMKLGKERERRKQPLVAR
jgi:hypothetical protein